MSFDDEVCNALRRKTLHQFRLFEGGSVTFYFGVVGDAAAVPRLIIDSAWRVCECGRPVVGSLDEPETILPVLQNLCGRQPEVQHVDVNTANGDLHLKFDGDISFQSFSYSWIDEQWEFKEPSGLRVRFGPEFTPAVDRP